MNTFNKLLNEALENTSGVTVDEYLNFATAIITSTSTDKIPAAIERAMALSSSELTSIIKQVQFTGDTKALHDIIANKPEYMTQFLELGRKILPEEELLQKLETEGTKEPTKNAEIDMRYVKGPPEKGYAWNSPPKTMENLVNTVPCPDCDNYGMTYDLSEPTGSHRQKNSWDVSLNCPSCGLDLRFCQFCSSWSSDTTRERVGNDQVEYDQCAECTAKKSDAITYNAEGDYYNQGGDGGGH